ncbi:unnamed protein product [Calypogeia fissa]
MVAQGVMEKTSTRVIVDILRKLGSDHVNSSQASTLHNLLLDELQKVEVVDLSRRKIGDQGIAALGKALQDCPVPKLERLSLEANDIGHDGIAAIGAAIGCGNLTSLKILQLSWNQIGEQGCKKLADGFLGAKPSKTKAATAVANNFSFEFWTLKKSRSRTLRRSGSVNREAGGVTGNSDHEDFSDDQMGMKSFKTAPHLHTLWLSGNNIGDAGAKALAEVFESGHCPALRVLRLFRNEIKADGAQALAKALKSGSFTRLEALNLGQNPITGDGTMALVSAFESHKLLGLKEVGLSFIPSMTAEGCISLARVIREGHLPALESLYLHRNFIGNDAAIALWRAFGSGRARQLKILDLEGNHIQATGITELHNVLRLGQVPHLEILDLVANSIGPEGGKMLGEAFQHRNTTSLKWLALAGNSIGDEGCVALAKAIEQDHLSGLQRLDLGTNSIGIKGVTAIAKAFERGKLPNLEFVSIDDNALDHRSAVALAGALKNNNALPALKHLSMKNNTLGDREKASEAFMAAYVKNVDLKTEVFYDWPDNIYATQMKTIMQERNKPEKDLSPPSPDALPPTSDLGCWSCFLTTSRKSNGGARPLDHRGSLTPTGSFRDLKSKISPLQSKSKFADMPPLARPPGQ